MATSIIAQESKGAIMMYRTANLGKASYLMFKGHRPTGFQKDGTKVYFCFDYDATTDAKHFEMDDVLCSPKQYNESMIEAFRMTRQVHSGQLKSSAVDF